MSTADRYVIYVSPHRPPRGEPTGGDWLVRVCREDDGEHVHSAEGGVELYVGLREAARAITADRKRDEA